MRDIGNEFEDKIGRRAGGRQAYRFATFSLSSGWLLPLMSLTSFAISPDMLSRSRRTRQVDDRPALVDKKISNGGSRVLQPRAGYFLASLMQLVTC